MLRHGWLSSCCLHPCPTTEQGRGVATRFTSVQQHPGHPPVRPPSATVAEDRGDRELLFTGHSETCVVHWLYHRKETKLSNPKKISLTVVVNGQPTVVDAFEDAILDTIIPDALRQTENSGQPPDNWELRDADGNLLDLNKKIGDYGFPPKARLFLNLKAGVGGHG